MTDVCTHVREEECDVLGVVQLVRRLLLQEGKPEIEAEQHYNVQVVSQEINNHLFHGSLKKFRFLPTNFKCLTQNGHIFRMILHFLRTDVKYFRDARQLLQQLQIV